MRKSVLKDEISYREKIVYAIPFFISGVLIGGICAEKWCESKLDISQSVARKERSHATMLTSQLDRCSADLFSITADRDAAKEKSAESSHQRDEIEKRLDLALAAQVGIAEISTQIKHLSGKVEGVHDEKKSRSSAAAIPDANYGRAGTIDQAAMVAAHNRWRSEVGVPGLRWSDKLAGIAQGWADQLKSEGCAMYHSGNGYGENIYKATARKSTDFKEKTPQQVTDSWGSEIKFYNYADNSCSGICGHYTQLVWGNTKEVGCAMAVCGSKAQVWVCNYFPAGNVAGKKPY